VHWNRGGGSPTAGERETLAEILRSSRGSLVMDGSQLSAADLVSLASRVASSLGSQGVGRGDCVALVDDGRGDELLAALFGVWWIGARATVIAGAASEVEVRSILRETGGALVVRREIPTALKATTFSDLLAGNTSTSAAVACVPGDCALDIASSGTTGSPKCASFTHGALSGNVHALARRLELTENDVLYSPLPLSVAGVLAMVVLPGLLAGAVVHVGRLGGARMATARNQVRAARPTLIYGVPYMYEVLARQPLEATRRGLRWAICSSAPLPSATFDRVWAHLGVPPRSSYCLVEAGTVTLNTCNDPQALRSTVGEVLDGVKIRVESISPEHSQGRIIIGGTSCAAGFRHAGELKAFPGGEVRTSDVGFIQGGRLTITGRSDEVIQVAGQNVDLGMIREVMRKCPGLGEFAVVVSQQERLGRVPILLAESGSLTVSPREVIAFCRTVLRDIEVPREVRVVSEIPRTATGKVRLTTEPGSTG